jgi:hypothetical protein
MRYGFIYFRPWIALVFLLVIWINFISLAPDACLPSAASAEEGRLACPVK